MRATLITIWDIITKCVCIICQANATSTFNILNEEGRIVAAAMLPQGT
jgi:uncharacterized protein